VIHAARISLFFAGFAGIIAKFHTYNMESAKKVIDKTQAMAKAEHFCAYQERSQQEVRDKLYSFDLHSADVENIISELIQANFLNEQRFAVAYTLGKFRIKHWGKAKIKQGLKFKRVPEKMIAKALGQIDYDEYISTLTALLQKKAPFITEKDLYKKNYKLAQYAVGRGFERGLVTEVLGLIG
jgi:regulatory protein